MSHHKYKELYHMDSLELYNIIKIIKATSNPTILNELAQCDFLNLYKYHFGYGLWIRNNFLYKKTNVLNFFNNIGITDIDDISTLIIQLLYIELRSETKNKSNRG